MTTEDSVCGLLLCGMINFPMQRLCTALCLLDLSVAHFLIVDNTLYQTIAEPELDIDGTIFQMEGIYTIGKKQY